MPDAFLKYYQMLYVRVHVNEEPTIAYIDSGYFSWSDYVYLEIPE